MQEATGLNKITYCDYVYYCYSPYNPTIFNPIAFNTCTFLSTPTELNIGYVDMYGFGKFD